VVNPLVAGTPVTHIVQPGESLTLIAQQYGVTVQEILDANNIPNANRIFRGQELTIWTTESVNSQVVETTNPAAAEAPGAVPTAGNTIYVVQPGERLSQIALRYGISWPILAQVNNIANPDLLYAGQEIIIPALNAEGGVADLGILSIPAVNAPPPTITVGKQVVVDLSDQRVFAYDNGVMVYTALASTGLPGTPTVVGDFTVYLRLRSQRMVGPGYDLPNVEWVQYFFQGYALHGTYWHNNFGQPMSHGCVNLTNTDALWFYEWATIGTPVHVQY
jgi:lipoprotein-anchoring transpeptidase ErfK/SrfK